MVPRRLVDVSKRDIGIELFGRHLAAPFLIGPTGLNAAPWPKGDMLLARAAERAGLPFVLATASNANGLLMAPELSGRWQLRAVCGAVAIGASRVTTLD